MLYFAMIDGQQRGPYKLEELPDAGVRPDTYVWCKGMADWEKAEDVADICRLYRLRIFDMMHGGLVKDSSIRGEQQQDSATSEDPYAAVPARFREFARRAGVDPAEFGEINPEPDISRPPMPTLFISLLATIFCSPITGLVGVYYSFKAMKAWKESERQDQGGNLYTRAERRDLKLKAHDYSRRAKMWIGITFFVGIIITALVGSHII